jgi:molybdate transport system substrate-binding protein
VTLAVGPAAAASAATIALALALALGGCGGNGSSRLEVSAAASLRRPFTQYGHRFRAAAVRYSFAGSDALAAQIEQGIRPDVFASANMQLPEMLFAKGLVERPVVFAANRLVLAVARHSTIAGLGALERPGVSIAVGAPTVPVGSYTTLALARLPVAQRRKLLGNIRDREPDVTGIVGKLLQGAVDAGFLYATDVAAAGGQLRAISLPAELQPQISYGAAVVKGAAHLAQARAFISGLLRDGGRADLLRDGFLAPPSR